MLRCADLSGLPTVSSVSKEFRICILIGVDIPMKFLGRAKCLVEIMQEVSVRSFFSGLLKVVFQLSTRLKTTKIWLKYSTKTTYINRKLI